MFMSDWSCIPTCLLDVVKYTGGLYGFTRLDSQLLISNAFAKFEQIPDKILVDPVTHDIFARETVKSRELYAWSQLRGQDSVPLHYFPCAFQEVQERSLCGQNERQTELEHFLAQQAGKRGVRYICA